MSVEPALSVIEILRIKDPNALLIVLEKILVTYITEKICSGLFAADTNMHIFLA